VIFLWSLLLCIPLALAPEIFSIFGPKYHGAVLPFKILIFALAFRIFVVIDSPVLSSYGYIKHMVVISMMVGVINLILDFILIRHIGIIGASIATTIAFAFGTLSRSALLKRKLELDVFRFLPYLLPIFVTFGAVYYIQNMLLRVVILSTVIGLSLFIGRGSGIFNAESLNIIDSIEMPHFMRTGIKKYYGYLAR
jgi:O-antigen/teichoic acid export membrane protein